ncbi:exonuclease SbcC [Dyadobacter jejuensis]|uniref:Exonuclease SbcC n=1 Tax=Dyadobacter jejuensis TaxID=1082580 RepID=A0A316ACN0_9BACT|nr:SMC family ATPase [Dyadobacter jejuensis]PWJ54730.1 exonuclease SbcC [Dyadobacter jejuensis]
MIPKYLKIKGLYSYQQEQEIHFDDLTNASLFGIFGAVGSGKSSILEAITFALYGDTERLNKSGDDRTYNMMNLRSDELLIDFECIAGKNGNRYRFTVRGRRNSKNFKDVKTFERKGYSWKEEQWVPLSENESIEDIIGLSYDNFRRTIIIPQGRFQEFIELRDADRTRMMKELFQLEKYDLSRKVATLMGKNKEAIAHVEGQLTGMTAVTTELIAQQEGMYEAVRLEIGKASEQVNSLTLLAETFQKQKLALENIRILTQQLKDLEAQEGQMKQRRASLAIFEICSLHFKPLLDQKKRLAEILHQEESQLEKLASQIDRLSTTRTERQSERVGLLPAYENREALLHQAMELEKVIIIASKNKQIDQQMGALTRGEARLKERKEALLKKKNDRSALEKETSAHKNKLPDLTETGKIQAWYTKLEILTKKKTATLEEANQVNQNQKEVEELKRKYLLELTTNFQLELAPDSGLSEFEKSIEKWLLQHSGQKKELEAKFLEVQTKARLQQFATELQDGAPCPLCGSEHHPALLHPNDEFNTQLKQLTDRKAFLEQQEKELRKAQPPIDRLFQQISSFEQQKTTIRSRWNEEKVALEEHDQLFVWPQFDRKDSARFLSYFEQTVQLQKTIKEQELLLKEASVAIEAEEIEIQQKLEAPLQSLKDEVLKAQSTIDTLTGQLTNIQLDDYRHKNSEALTDRVENLRKKYTEVKTKFEHTEKEIAELEKQIHALGGEQRSLLESRARHQAEFENLGQAVQQRLLQHAYESEEWVGQVLLSDLDIGTERNALDRFDLQIHTIRRDLQNQKEQNPISAYDPEQHEATNRKLQHLQKQLQTLTKEEGRLEGLLKQLKEDLIKRTTLLQEQERLDIRKNHLNDLAKLFRSSGFVDYASSIYLQNLIQAANGRFHQMTHQQLHLELGEGNSFWVRDLLNGGHLRLLKTLSGGQKFQAALSLALALADHIHVRNASKHNFFFLDEGFGSLDKAALQTVFETLKTLRKEHRIVGIISHVEDLQQEIQTYLKIEESETGSKIIPSWL